MIRKFWFFFLFALVIAMFAVAQEDEDDDDALPYPPNALLVAAYMGDVGLVQEILAAGVDTDYRSASGGTALHMAILQNNIEVVKLLLDYGFSPNAKDSKDGYTCLHMAVAANNPEAVRLLLQYKVDKNIKCFAGLTALEKARKEDKADLVRLLYR